MKENILKMFSDLWPLATELQEKEPDDLWKMALSLEKRYPDLTWGIGYGKGGNQILGVFKNNRSVIEIHEYEIIFMSLENGSMKIISYREI